MIKYELKRMQIDSDKILKNDKLKRVEHYCTMNKGKWLCKKKKLVKKQAILTIKSETI